MSGVFLSYSRGDRALADQIVRGLRAVGVDVWWDEDMRGVDWQEELERQISGLAGVVVVWTGSSANSRNVRDEARLALETGKLVNVIQGVPKPPFPYDRVNGLPLDGWDGRRPHHGWDRLIETVESLVVQAGGAEPGDIVGAQARRGEELRAKQAGIDQAQDAFQDAQTREAEVSETAKQAGEAVSRAEEQLQSVVEMRAAPLILHGAQQELETARAAKDEAEKANRAARAELSEASRALTRAKAEVDGLFSESTPPPRKPYVPAAAPVDDASLKTDLDTPKPAPTPKPKPTADPAPRADTVIVPQKPDPVSPRSKRPSSTMWLAIGGVAVVLIVVVLAMLGNKQPTSTNTVVAPEKFAQTGGGTGGDAATGGNPVADALAGNWSLPGLGCDTPVTIEVKDDAVTLTSSGGQMSGKIQPGFSPGVTRTVNSDGVYTYKLDHNTSLSVTGPTGPYMELTRCAG